MGIRCSSYCVSETYQLDALDQFIDTLGLVHHRFDEVIHITFGMTSPVDTGIHYNILDPSGGHIFCFHYGCIIFWGIPEELERYFLLQISPYVVMPLSLTHTIIDTSEYCMGLETHIDEEENLIMVSSSDPLIKLSISHGLAQSVKLTAFEHEISKTITSTRYLPKELADYGRTSLSRKKIAQQIGALFAQRNFVNLHTDLLDTPEFFWKRPKYEGYYEMAIDYLDIRTRLSIVNQRLDVIHELYGILSDELKHRHSAFLEIVIVCLISVEILITILSNILRH